MYLKVTALNGSLNVKFIDMLGSEVVPYTTLLTKVYNKLGTDYFQVQESTLSTFELQTDKITNRSEIYIDLYLDDNMYKSKLLVDLLTTEVRTRYKISYTSQLPVRDTSNTFLKRISIGMPQWSSAFKNDISLFSKSFYPFYLFAEKLYYKTNEHLYNNLTNTKHARNIILSLEPLSLKNIVTDKFIGKSYIKEKERINNVTKTLIVTSVSNFTISFDNFSEFPIKLSNVFNRVFIKTQGSCLVFLKGYDNNNNIISEVITSDGAVSSVSKHTYTEIISVDSDTTYNGVIECTTGLACLDTKSNYRTDFKLAGNVRDNKDIVVPYYKYNNETCCLNVYYSKTQVDIADYEDSYYIPTMKDCRNYFVTDTDDLVFTNTSGKLCYGLLRKDLDTAMTIHASNNNNTIVSTLNDNVASENTVEFVISTQTIMDMYGVYSVCVSVDTDGVVYYLNDNNELVDEKVYKVINNVTPIYIEFDTTSAGYISVVTEVNNINYQASILKHRIPTVVTDLSVTTLTHNGSSLIDYHNATEVYKISTFKDYYEYIDDLTINYSEYGNGSEIELKNIRGYKDGKFTV